MYTATGTKKGTLALPAELFAIEVNEGLIHQLLVRQQSNRRTNIAHVKSRGEVVGSTRKLFQQKGTGRARRGSANSPVLRSGGKAFGPRNNANYVKDMPRKMRRKALACCLSKQAKAGSIFGLEGYKDDAKTKQLLALLGKLPVELGRKILIVVDERNEALYRAARNIPGVKVLTAAYLNAEDVLNARYIAFSQAAADKAASLFAAQETAPATKTTKSAAAKKETKAAPKKSTTTKSTK